MTDAQVDASQENAQRELRAFRLAEVRKQSAATQREIAERMHVTQGRVSQIESGQLDTSELGTLRSYVEALGGKLRVAHSPRFRRTGGARGCGRSLQTRRDP